MSSNYPTTSAAQREILFNAFDMNWVVHQSPGLWRDPDDRARESRDVNLSMSTSGESLGGCCG